jgi:HK97 family phage major capsid protein
MHQVKLELVKLAALGYVTDELLADASALDSVMTTSFGEELRFLVEDSIINGTGAGKPKGILKAAALVSVAKESGQVAASVVYENIVKMWSRMYAPLRRNAVWLINQDVEPQLFTMSLAVGTGGRPVFMPASGAAGSPFSTLFGRPVIPVEYCQTLGTKGDIYLANFSEYAYITKGGVQTASSMHVAFTTDEMTFKATMRVDGQSKWRSALTPFKGTSTQAPFISLDVRA